MELVITTITDNAKLPSKATNEAAGYDLFSVTKVTIEPMQRVAIHTGILIKIPEGMYGRIAPRSGLALRNGIDVMAGVIDSDYRGEIMVILINLSSEPFRVKPGDKIAQLILEKCYHLGIKHVRREIFDTKTERGDKGFGSSDQIKN